jgi:hypothetical protein
VITVGFTTIGQGDWTGGDTYLRNMLGMISRELGGRVKSKLFISEHHRKRLASSQIDMVETEVVVDPVFEHAGHRSQLPSILLSGRAKDAEDAFRANGVDVVFEAGAYYGRRFGLPIVSWIPDFQHRRLPKMFPRTTWLRREIGYRLLCRSHRTIMLSSENAREDCELFYPSARGKTRVVRFAIDFDPTAELTRKKEMMEAYGLPDRFFYLPNQFWAHKNHRLVVDALRSLMAKGSFEHVLPIVLTGRGDDPRRPAYFPELTAEVQAAGLTPKFIYLGLVPYNHVFALAGSCEAIINPSLFEGWSTTVEEAKGLGARLLLSYIPIHREQAPSSTFFSPTDPEQLANILLEVSLSQPVARPSLAQLMDAQAARRRDYALAFLTTLEAAIARGAPSRKKHIVGQAAPAY